MPVDLEIQGRVAHLTLNRPERRNAINEEMASGLASALDRIEGDPDIWVGILCAKGPVFCAGADLGEIAEGRSAEIHPPGLGFAGIVERKRRKPLVAAVEGPALAGGFEIALACDLIVASQAASFGLPEVSRSIIAAAGGLFRTPRKLPVQVAMEMALTAESIDAERAYNLGLVNRLTEAGQARDEAQAMATRISENAPLAVQASRRAVIETASADDDIAFAINQRLMREIAATEDFREGPKAFLEKRKPEWTGR